MWLSIVCFDEVRQHVERHEDHGAAQLHPGRLGESVERRLRPHHRVPGYQVPHLTGLLTNRCGRPVQCTALRLRLEGEVSLHFQIYQRVRWPFTCTAGFEASVCLFCFVFCFVSFTFKIPWSQVVKCNIILYNMSYSFLDCKVPSTVKGRLVRSTRWQRRRARVRKWILTFCQSHRVTLARKKKDDDDEEEDEEEEVPKEII